MQITSIKLEDDVIIMTIKERTFPVLLENNIDNRLLMHDFNISTFKGISTSVCSHRATLEREAYQAYMEQSNELEQS